MLESPEDARRAGRIRPSRCCPTACSTELRAKETGNDPDPESQPLTGRDIGVLVFVIALIGVNAYSLINEWGLMFWGLLFP